MKNNSCILKATDISKSFPGVKALDKVSLNIEKGEVHALVGENGAGKSTLIKIITGIYKADEGSIYIEGERVFINSVKDSVKYGISCIYQEPEFVQDLTIAENIFMGNIPKNRIGLVNWRELFGETIKLFEIFDLELNPRLILKELSTAQKKLIEILKAFSKASNIIIMDEPTAALTSDEIEKLFNVVKKLKSKGISVINISHRINEIFEIADRVTILRDGKYIDTLDVKNTNQDEVIKLMIGRTVENLFPKTDTQIGQNILSIKKFTKNRVFENISFCLRKGEILGIAGLVGSGRSELANAIFGIEKVDSGEIFINGEPTRINKPQDAIKNGICMTAEERKTEGLFLELSVKENLIISSMDKVGKFGFVNEYYASEIAQSFINTLSIDTPTMGQLVKFLSGGNQQKVVLGKWLAAKPKVLLLNEPTRGIDVGAKAEFYSIVGKLIQEGNTSIIIFSSEIRELVSVCDRIFAVFNGKIVAELSRKSEEWDSNIEKRLICYCITGR